MAKRRKVKAALDFKDVVNHAVELVDKHEKGIVSDSRAHDKALEQEVRQLAKDNGFGYVDVWVAALDKWQGDAEPTSEPDTSLGEASMYKLDDLAARLPLDESDRACLALTAHAAVEQTRATFALVAAVERIYKLLERADNLHGV